MGKFETHSQYLKVKIVKISQKTFFVKFDLLSTTILVSNCISNLLDSSIDRKYKKNFWIKTTTFADFVLSLFN